MVNNSVKNHFFEKLKKKKGFLDRYIYCYLSISKFYGLKLTGETN